MGAIKQTDNRVRPQDAARELEMSLLSFQHAMQNNAFPISIGIAIKKKGNENYSYYIYRGALDELKKLWGITKGGNTNGENDKNSKVCA